jgi:hypothetical protein
MSSNLLVGSVVYGGAGIGCKVLKIKGAALIVQTPNGIRKIAFSKVVKVEAPTDFWIGDRVTLQDKYMYRAGDVGTIESIDSQGIQILWDIQPQSPLRWRTFQSEELELIDRGRS